MAVQAFPDGYTKPLRSSTGERVLARCRLSSSSSSSTSSRSSPIFFSPLLRRTLVLVASELTVNRTRFIDTYVGRTRVVRTRKVRAIDRTASFNFNRAPLQSLDQNVVSLYLKNRGSLVIELCANPSSDFFHLRVKATINDKAR